MQDAIMFTTVLSRSCGHSVRSTCDQCVYQYARSQVMNDSNAIINCPEAQCSGIMENVTIGLLFLHHKDEMAMKRLDRLALENCLASNDEFVWCAHGCGSGQFNDYGGKSHNNYIVTCVRCKQKTCFNHRIQWNSCKICRKNIQDEDEKQNRFDAENKESEKWKKAHTKSCPQCRAPIEKNSGCDHMKCFKCKHEFCWECFATYELIRKDGNHRHQSNCKHFRPIRNA